MKRAKRKMLWFVIRQRKNKKLDMKTDVTTKRCKTITKWFKRVAMRLKTSEKTPSWQRNGYSFSQCDLKETKGVDVECPGFVFDWSLEIRTTNEQYKKLIFKKMYIRSEVLQHHMLDCWVRNVQTEFVFLVLKDVSLLPWKAYSVLTSWWEISDLLAVSCTFSLGIIGEKNTTL